jgi:hypothetical protein
VSKKPYRIPFNGKKMMEYASCRDGETGDGYWQPSEWRDVVEFDAELEVFDCRKGRSAVRFYVRDVANNEEYSMGFVSFFNIVKRLRDGRISGRWTFRKQGGNYGLVAAE